KIHPRHQVTQQSAGKHGDIQMTCLHLPVGALYDSRLDGHEMEGAFDIGSTPTKTLAVRRRHLYESIGNRVARPVQYLTLDSNRPVAAGVDHQLARFKREPDAEEWSDSLRRRQRPAHVSFSNGVASRPGRALCP